MYCVLLFVTKINLVIPYWIVIRHCSVIGTSTKIDKQGGKVLLSFYLRGNCIWNSLKLVAFTEVISNISLSPHAVTMGYRYWCLLLKLYVSDFSPVLCFITFFRCRHFPKKCHIYDKNTYLTATSQYLF